MREDSSYTMSSYSPHRHGVSGSAQESVSAIVIKYCRGANLDSSLGLVLLQEDTDDPGHGAHCGVQHVTVLGGLQSNKKSSQSEKMRSLKFFLTEFIFLVWPYLTRSLLAW